MYDDDDDFETHEKPSELPRELRERLFDASQAAPGRRELAIRYSEIGPARWPAPVVFGAERGFTVWRNPRAQDVRLVINLGPDHQLHAGFEMALIPPQYRISRSRAAMCKAKGLSFRPEYSRMLVVIPAGGKLEIPSVFDHAIRTEDRNGVVVGGLAHFLIKVINGVDEPNPPPLHSALMPTDDESDHAPMRGAAARRRT